MKKFVTLFLSMTVIMGFAKINIPETPFTAYTFPSKDCKLIKHNQSRIFVPANTFYLDGKLYEGEVNLKYREFVDQLDIILNHIPMNYAENNKQHVLESGGMFELYAYGNGKLLSFAPNKKISVQLASKFDVAGGETFVLNKESNTWEKKTSFGKSPESNEVLSENKEDLWGDRIWQNDDGWQMQTDTMLVYDPSSGGNTYNVVSVAAMRMNTFKTINVDKFEFYNCDRILKEDAVPVVAEFDLLNYDQKLNSEIYVVYKNRNAVITYYPEQFATDFKLLPGEAFTIFTYGKDGKIAILDNTFLDHFDVLKNKNKKVVFPMKVYANTPATKEELATLTGL